MRAVRAAAEIRTRLPALAQEVGVELRFRTGVNTGLVLVGEGENLAIGDAVNVAARLEQAAQPGEILLGESTHRLVRDAVEVEPLEALSLEGKSEPVAAFRLLAVDPLAPGLARRFDVPLVGRERELRATARSVGPRGRRGGLSSVHVAGSGRRREVAAGGGAAFGRRRRGPSARRAMSSLRRRDHVLAAAGGAVTGAGSGARGGAGAAAQRRHGDAARAVPGGAA